MKIWLLCLAGLVLFIVAGLLVQSNLEQSTVHFSQELNRVEAALEVRDWHRTGQNLRRLNSDWERTKFLWALMLNHKEIDAIEQSLIRSEKAVDTQSYNDAAIELGSLRYFLKHVPQRERVDLINIF